MILLSVRWYLRFGLSYRDLEELLAERGIRSAQRFACVFAGVFQPRVCRGRPLS